MNVADDGESTTRTGESDAPIESGDVYSTFARNIFLNCLHWILYTFFNNSSHDLDAIIDLVGGVTEDLDLSWSDTALGMLLVSERQKVLR